MSARVEAQPEAFTEAYPETAFRGGIPPNAPDSLSGLTADVDYRNVRPQDVDVDGIGNIPMGPGASGANFTQSTGSMKPDLSSDGIDTPGGKVLVGGNTDTYFSQTNGSWVVRMRRQTTSNREFFTDNSEFSSLRLDNRVSSMRHTRDSSGGLRTISTLTVPALGVYFDLIGRYEDGATLEILINDDAVLTQTLATGDALTSVLCLLAATTVAGDSFIGGFSRFVTYNVTHSIADLKLIRDHLNATA